MSEDVQALESLVAGITFAIAILMVMLWVCEQIIYFILGIFYREPKRACTGTVSQPDADNLL